jgi:hypothetical protein
MEIEQSYASREKQRVSPKAISVRKEIAPGNRMMTGREETTKAGRTRPGHTTTTLTQPRLTKAIEPIIALVTVKENPARPLASSRTKKE